MCPAALPGPQFSAPQVRGAAKTVALTFDDGPGRSTQAIIEILESFHVRATFFNVGQEEVYRPQLVREEAADGFLLGDHTVGHPVMAGLSPAAQATEIDGVAHETRQLTQTSPCVFRPPYGSYDSTTLAVANARSMSLWMWNVSSDDWEARGSGSAYWIHRIISDAEAGIGVQHAVVLFHNQPIRMPATVAALPVVISFYERHGYTFVDLLGRAGPPGGCGSSTSAPLRVPGTFLNAGTSMGAGAIRRSPSGQFSLAVRPDGDAILRLATGRVLWTSRTAGHPGARLVVSQVGDVEVRSPAGNVLWSTKTSGHRGARLDVSDAGNLQLEVGRTALWVSSIPVSQLSPGERLRPGWRLTSADARCTLLQQSAGRLALLDATGQVLWRTGAVAPGAFAALEANGNLVVVASRSASRWVSGTTQHGPTRLVVTTKGKLVISAVTGLRLWTTP